MPIVRSSIFNVKSFDFVFSSTWFWYHDLQYSLWKPATVVFVDMILIFFVLWKTYWHRGLLCTVENLLTSYVSSTWYWHRVYRGKLTDIVRFVNIILTSCVPWKTYSHRVYRGKLTNIMCTVENWLTSSVSSTWY